MRTKRRAFRNLEKASSEIKPFSRRPDKGTPAGKGARARFVSGDGGTEGAQLGGREVLRFTPNFTVYMVSPDTVCLYSEHRKFFLHGALYCALAPAIAAGKSLRELVSELEEKFPADKICEALTFGWETHKVDATLG